MLSIRKVLLFTLLAVTMLLAGAAPAMASGHGTARQLSAAQAQVKVLNLKKLAHKHQSVVYWWNHGGKWALGLKHKSCSEFKGAKRRKVCNMARQSLAYHAHHAKLVERKLASLAPWANDLRRTYEYRQCLIDHESRTANPPMYLAENGGTPGVESSFNSDASGAYQFLDGTWRARFAAAKQYYGPLLSGSWTHAAYAPPLVQDIVAAFSIISKDLRGRDWTHSDCRNIYISYA